MLSYHPDTLEWLVGRGTVLVGVSGGRDSVALIELLSGVPGCDPAVCHLHHGIRGEQADRDARFVEDLAQRLGLSLFIGREDVPRMAAERKCSVEEAARLARQDFFATLSATGHGCVVALAHHRDDQAETVMMNLCRGGGGLRGMKPVSHWPGGVTVVRPLLDCSRQQINAFVVASGLEWVDDETNTLTDCTRNAIRHEIMPQLNAIMGRDVSLPLSRTARLHDEQGMALEQAIEVLGLMDPQRRLYLPKLETLPDALKKAAVFLYLKDRGVPDLSEECVMRVLAILPIDAPARTSLPGGWSASRKERRLRLEQD